MIQVKSLLNPGESAKTSVIRKSVDEIFFESSPKKSFASASEREAFKFKYLDWYSQNLPQYFLVALGEKSEVLGYVCGVADTRRHEDLAGLHPWFEIFEDCYPQFPAHLHINCAESARGRSIGSTLLAVFESCLRSDGVAGVHLVTSPDARNVGFYDKNGYKFTKTMNWKDSKLLLMGKSL
ncbi:MAG: GNAT family N-acetyltransferase [Proteobacteria bacterium]|nr:GNAT family N-acetyltransferase [Pseudomonadota bacterium]